MELEGRVRALVSDGDVGAAATLAIRELAPVVLGYLRTMLRDGDEVADGLSQWSEHVWRGLPAFEFRSSLRTWAIRVAVNVALNRRNQADRRHVRRFETGEASAIAASVRTTTSRSRRRRALEELRRELTGEQQTLLFLRVDQELPWGEIAEMLSSAGDPVDAGTVSKRYERLKAQLQKAARRRHLIS